MDYQELLFAAHVRSLAVDLRHTQLKKAAEEISETEELKKFIVDWHAQNPIANYVLQALEEITKVANAIKKQNQ